jgi:hypothetical protein
MIVLTDRARGIKCFDCGEPIEGSHILLPHPWDTVALHVDCARDLGAKLIDEAMERYCSVLAPPPKRF